MELLSKVVEEAPVPGRGEVKRQSESVCSGSSGWRQELGRIPRVRFCNRKVADR
jgi:hypothetical protein